MKILGADLHAGQRDVVQMVQSTSKYATCVAPRQTGKSFIAQQVVLYWALNHPKARIFWVAPTYAQARKPFEEIFDGIYRSGAIKQANKSELQIKFQNGSTIYFKSVERPDNLRGFTADFMICDEAAYYPEEVWAHVLKPITLVHGKKVLFISTPRSKNWFFDMYNLGISKDHEDYESCRMTYEQNPWIDQEEIEEARRTLPEHIFKAEYEGSFVDSGSTVFANLEKNTFSQYPKTGSRFYCGIDLGRQGDYTVATVVNDLGQVVEIYRDNQKEWPYMISEIVKLLKKWNAKALVEANGIGDVVLDQIKREWRDTEPFITTSTSKQQIIEGLVVAFNKDEIKIPSKALFQPLMFELEIFEYTYSPKARTIQYGHPVGMNDDTVMSLAIAWRAREAMKNSGSYVVAGKKLY